MSAHSNRESGHDKTRKRTRLEAKLKSFTDDPQRRGDERDQTSTNATTHISTRLPQRTTKRQQNHGRTRATTQTKSARRLQNGLAHGFSKKRRMHIVETYKHLNRRRPGAEKGDTGGNNVAATRIEATNDDTEHGRSAGRRNKQPPSQTHRNRQPLNRY